MALTFVGGLTLESRRKNIVLPIEDASLPAVVRLKLQDNCIPVVCAGEKVAEGEKVAANADGFCLLSSVCGTVMSAGDGFVTVRSERSGEPVGLPPVESPVVSLSYEDVSERLKQAGIVGAMSGIPLYQKLARAKGKAKRIVINCLESDPYSAHISRLVTDHAEEIVNGAKILMHAVCVKRSVIAIEENRTEAIRALRNAVYDKTLVSTALFKPKYPAGNELLAINAIYGREVRSGRTAEESGYLVLSAETLLNVFHAFAYGTPQTRKVITVSGNAVNRKKILRVRNGTTADEIFANCDGFAVQPGAVIEGGIMRGKAITLDECATLSTNVLVALPKRPLDVDGDCIRCGRCVRVCPMHLAPLKLASQSKDGQIEDCLAIGLDACIECGCCAYVCLGKVNLLRHIRAAKAQAHPPAGEQPQASPSTKEGAENTKARRLETAEPSSAATGEPPAPQQPAVRTELPADERSGTEAEAASAAPAEAPKAADPVKAFYDAFGPAAEAHRQSAPDRETKD